MAVGLSLNPRSKKRLQGKDVQSHVTRFSSDSRDPRQKWEARVYFARQFGLKLVWTSRHLEISTSSFSAVKLALRHAWFMSAVKFFGWGWGAGGHIKMKPFLCKFTLGVFIAVTSVSRLLNAQRLHLLQYNTLTNVKVRHVQTHCYLPLFGSITSFSSINLSIYLSIKM